MGKVKRLRQKFHIAKNKTNPLQIPQSINAQNIPDVALTLPSNDLFAGLNIDVGSLKTKLNDDTQSVKTFKSTKSEKIRQSTMSKKEKIKLRKELLLQKIDSINQMKKEFKLREKRKTTAIIGDTNPLHDALPSLESLLKNRPYIKQSITEPKKKKGIEKAKKRKKELIQGVKIYKTISNNKTFKENPLEAITQHLQAFVSHEKQRVKKH